MDKFEQLVEIVFKKWKEGKITPSLAHPDEETLACFLEGGLEIGESQDLIAHLLVCQDCAEIVEFSLNMEPQEASEVPEEALERVRNIIFAGDKSSALEIALKIRGKILELLNTTGDVLVGQELVPAPVLRSRAIKDFKDEVTILKDFKNMRVEVKVENKGNDTFNLFIAVMQKETQMVIKDMRVTLLKEDLELESYLSDTGTVVFEHVLLGKYKVEISSVEEKLASVLLDIKI